MNGIKQRSSKIEILRIIAMVMIVAHHFTDHGNIIPLDGVMTVNNIWAGILYMWGKEGINIFVLITGYFLIDHEDFSIKRIVRLWIKIFTASVVGFLFAFFVLHVETKGITTFCETFFPIMFSSWWFMTTYMLLYISFPYINRLVKSLNKEEYHKLIIFLTSFLIIMLLIRNELILWNGITGNFLWFIYLYILSAYLKLHGEYITNMKIKWGIIAIVLILIKIIVWIIIYSTKFDLDLIRYTAMNRPFTFLIALSLFMHFKDSNIKSNKLINVIASTTFGVYIVHEHPMIRDFMWQKIFKCDVWINSDYFIIYSIGVVILLFAICALIDLFFQNTMGKLVDKYLKH